MKIKGRAQAPDQPDQRGGADHAPQHSVDQAVGQESRLGGQQASRQAGQAGGGGKPGLAEGPPGAVQPTGG